MRILFCMGGFNKGGAERVVVNLANYLQVKGHDVGIAVSKIDKMEYSLNDKIKVFVLDNSIKKNFIVKNFCIQKKLKKTIMEFNPDIILSFLQTPTLRMLLLKIFSYKVHKIPLIVSLRINPENAFSSIKGKIIKLLYRFSDGFVFQTPSTKEYFSKKIQDKSTVIANPINPVFFKDFYEGERQKRIVSVGRLEEQKNFPLLISSFKDFCKDFDDYTLDIYGVGKLHNELESLIKRYNLTDKIFLHGNSDNIIEDISRAGMFIMTSNFEGLSNALMESMTLGIPCISTDHLGGGAKMLIKDGFNGFLVPINDKKGIVDKMKLLANDKELAYKISKNSWESMKKYDYIIINNKWLEYIKKVIGGYNK